MKELELTLMSADAELDKHLQAALDAFELEHRIKVHVTLLDWDSGRAELVHYAMYKDSPDVSEVGVTWLGSLVSMDALRPFTPREITNMGGADAFLPHLWQSGVFPGNKIIAAPWLSDARVIYYRRDLLQETGIEEETAFQSVERWDQTLQKLKTHGVALPWVTPTRRSPVILANVAPWVWAEGGHFMSADGRHPRFHEPEAKRGLLHYFSSHFKYLTPNAYQLTPDESIQRFLQGQAAATVDGTWILDTIYRGDYIKVTSEQVGVAKTPFPSFIGGTGLVVWKYGRQQTEAVKLVEFLTSYEVQDNYLPKAAILPARLDVLQKHRPHFMSEETYAIVFNSMETGQSFKAAYLWGMVEDRLVTTLHTIWQALFKDSNLDLEATIDHHTNKLAKRLEQTLSGA